MCNNEANGPGLMIRHDSIERANGPLYPLMLNTLAPRPRERYVAVLCSSDRSGRWPYDKEDKEVGVRNPGPLAQAGIGRAVGPCTPDYFPMLRRLA